MARRIPADRTVGIRITMNVPGLERARAAFEALPNNLASKHIGAALKRAAENAGVVSTLKQNTPKGETGNLRRAAAIKVKKYPRSGTAWAIVGFKSGRKFNEPYDPTKLGYHQGLVEFGTKERFRKSPGGVRVSTGKMPLGGSYGRAPVRSTWEQTRSRVEGLLVQELTRAFDAAARELAAQIRDAQGPF